MSVAASNHANNSNDATSNNTLEASAARKRKLRSVGITGVPCWGGQPRSGVDLGMFCCNPLCLFEVSFSTFYTSTLFCLGFCSLFSPSIFVSFARLALIVEVLCAFFVTYFVDFFFLVCVQLRFMLLGLASVALHSCTFSWPNIGLLHLRLSNMLPVNFFLTLLFSLFQVQFSVFEYSWCYLLQPQKRYGMLAL